MELRRLKLAFLAALAALLLFLEWTRSLLEPYLLSWSGRLLFAAVVGMCIIFLVGAAFSVMSRMQERLTLRNRELLALDRAARDIYGELSLETILQKVIDQARILLDAKYGAISVLDGERRILQFLTSGMSQEMVDQIGAPPEGRGLLGVMIQQDEQLRLSGIDSDPRAAGVPAHHPTMNDLLGVPINCKSPFKGNIYLTDKVTGRVFTREDEETLVRFASTASVAIDNSYLHQQLQSFAVAEERSRIGREMHDGMAQILAYVNAKAQTVGEYLRSEQAGPAMEQLQQLAAAAREAYTDVREGILALRTQPGSERTLTSALREFFEHWQERSGVAGELRIDETMDLALETELQLLRITQEALTNVRKHASAGRIDVDIVARDGCIVATIADDGVGFDPESLRRSPFPRFGLAIMRERAESVGGSLSVQSSPEGGTRVRIEVPQEGRA
ncbi:MAG: GAF domain-containing sensor histidine kinase [Acidobacteriota bacterium]|nr:GAF domain-containing sensor histidine kinase [Acidobacteriota bacterium]